MTASISLFDFIVCIWLDLTHSLVYRWDILSPLIPLAVQLLTSFVQRSRGRQVEGTADKPSSMSILLGVSRNNLAPKGRKSLMQSFCMQSHKQLLNHAGVIHGPLL